jgi:hypothetical protein
VPIPVVHVQEVCPALSTASMFATWRKLALQAAGVFLSHVRWAKSARRYGSLAEPDPFGATAL